MFVGLAAMMPAMMPAMMITVMAVVAVMASIVAAMISVIAAMIMAVMAAPVIVMVGDQCASAGAGERAKARPVVNRFAEDRAAGGADQRTSENIVITVMMAMAVMRMMVAVMTIGRGFRAGRRHREKTEESGGERAAFGNAVLGGHGFFPFPFGVTNAIALKQRWASQSDFKNNQKRQRP